MSEPPTTSQPLKAPQRSGALGGPGSPQLQDEGQAQQAKHTGSGAGVVPTGPPQQSRHKWQHKASAQVKML